MLCFNIHLKKKYTAVLYKKYTVLVDGAGYAWHPHFYRFVAECHSRSKRVGKIKGQGL